MAIEFVAVLKPVEGIDAAYIEPPFDVEKEFGARRVKVRASIDGALYRGSIVRMGGRFMLGVTQQVRRAISKGPGDTVHVILEKDAGEREVEVPPELEDMLKGDSLAKGLFEAMSYSHRKGFSDWVSGAAKEETRLSRAGKAIALIRANKPLK